MSSYPYPGVPIVTHEGETIQEVLDKVLTSPEVSKLINGYQYDGTPPTLEIPGELEFVKMRVDEIVNKLLAMAGNYAYFFDKTSKLHIVNFDEVPGIDSSHGIKVESTNAVSFVTDRAMYWRSDNIDWEGGHSSFASKPSTSWYFAEGSTQGDFETWLVMLNPNASPVSVTITYMKEDGTTITQTISIAATSRYTIKVNDVSGMFSVGFGIKISASSGIIAERPMYWDVGDVDWMGGHCSRGATAPALQWYLSEGRTGGTENFGMWILIQNPNVATSNVKLTFMEEDGSTTILNTTVSATSRKSIYVNSTLANHIFATKVESINSISIVVERSMYWDAGGVTVRGGHCSLGSPSLSNAWYFAEGRTKGPFLFDQWLSLQNPGGSPSNVTITYMLPYSSPITQNVVVPATSRYSIAVHGITGVESTDVSMKVVSTNAVPIMAERVNYWDSNGIDWVDGHCSRGVTAPELTWYFAEGNTQVFDEWLLIQNPNTNTLEAKITFMQDDGTDVTHHISVPPLRRYTVLVNEIAINMRHLYVGEESENLTNHSEYNVISNDLTNSTENCYTKAIVTGLIEYEEFDVELQPLNSVGTLWDASIIPEEATDLSFYEVDYTGKESSVSGTYNKEDKTVETESLIRLEEQEYDLIAFAIKEENKIRRKVGGYIWVSEAEWITNKEWLLGTKEIRIKEGDTGGYDWVDGAVTDGFEGPYYDHYDQNGVLVDTTISWDTGKEIDPDITIMKKIQWDRWSNYYAQQDKQKKITYTKQEEQIQPDPDPDDEDQYEEKKKTIEHLSKLYCKYEVPLPPPYEEATGGNAKDLGLERIYYLTIDTTDSDILKEVAESIIKIYGDVEITGSVVIDGIQVNWQVSDGITIHNTARPDWEPMCARITQISFDLSNLTTTIQFTNRPAVGTMDIMSHINTKYKLEKVNYEVNQMKKGEPETY